MIDYIKQRMALRRLFKQKYTIRASYAKHVALARAEGKTLDDIRGIEHEAWFEEGIVDEEISITVTNYLVSKATMRFIAIPSRGEEGMWEQCNKISERYVLTNAGISALRSSLRAEGKERRDLIIPIIAAITGIIGTMTGLIAVMTK